MNDRALKNTGHVMAGDPRTPAVQAPFFPF
jgi:hypothetical protein